MKWSNSNLNVLIPMAGKGSRFLDVGYDMPKPLIEVLGMPMIQLVVEYLNMDANYIYVVRKDHNDEYDLVSFLNEFTPDCDVIILDNITEGAACTTLLADKYIDNDMALVITNADQVWINWNSNRFMERMVDGKYDGGIVTFPVLSEDLKWSYAKLNDVGLVERVAEKDPISTHATAGIYYWKMGCEYVKYAKDMIKKDIRVNNEFYVCPVYNEAISDGKEIFIDELHENVMWGLGTPEDLEIFNRYVNDFGMDSHLKRDLS